MLAHWLQHGIREGRQASPWFDPVYHMESNPDGAQAFGATNYRRAMSHWVR